jgi:uncharacterized protein GlcG (DUF336 family)
VDARTSVTSKKEKRAAMGRIRSAAAQKVIDAATTKALELRVPVSIAVVDEGGHLKGLRVMDETILGSIDIAQRKAKTAVYFGLNSEQVGKASQPGGPFYGVENSNGGLITFSGGVPLRDNSGAVWGAIGVSGGLPDQDGVVARAGAEAFSV